MGRPKSNPSALKDQMVSVRLTQQQYDQLVEVARQLGKSPPDLVRDMIQQFVGEPTLQKRLSAATNITSVEDDGFYDLLTAASSIVTRLQDIAARHRGNLERSIQEISFANTLEIQPTPYKSIDNLIYKESRKEDTRLVIPNTPVNSSKLFEGKK